VDAGPAGGDRREGPGGHEAVLVEFHAQVLGQFRQGGRRVEAHGENHHVEVFPLPPAGLVNEIQGHVAVELGGQGVDPAADEIDPGFLGPVVILLEILAVGADIHVEDGGVQVAAGVLLGDDRFLDGVHAADGRTVAVVATVQIARTDALEPGDAGRILVVAGPDHVALEGAGGREDALELHGGHDIGPLAVAVGLAVGRVEGVEPGGHNHAADVKFDYLVLLGMGL